MCPITGDVETFSAHCVWLRPGTAILFYSIRWVTGITWHLSFWLPEAPSTSEWVPDPQRGQVVAIPSPGEKSIPFDLSYCVLWGMTHNVGGAPHFPTSSDKLNSYTPKDSPNSGSANKDAAPWQPSRPQSEEVHSETVCPQRLTALASHPPKRELRALSPERKNNSTWCPLFLE